MSGFRKFWNMLVPISIYTLAGVELFLLLAIFFFGIVIVVSVPISVAYCVIWILVKVLGFFF